MLHSKRLQLLYLLIGLTLLLLLFSAAAAESPLRLLSNVAQAVKGRGTIAWIDCGYVTHYYFIFPLPLQAYFGIADLPLQ